MHSFSDTVARPTAWKTCGNHAGPAPPGEPDMLMEQMHWLDSVATEFRLAAARPWIPFDPRPTPGSRCRCGYHAARGAGTTR